MKKSHSRKPVRRRAPYEKVSVVIPALNESRTISNVVSRVLKERRTGEVIVIDDGSIDGTPELAEAAGARVITSSMLGKGVSMEEGMQAARYDYVVYLDGDMRGLRRGIIKLLVAPLIAGEADFVKARFVRKAGRVTALTAKPLLQTYFPELAGFAQPLGGIMAARRSLLHRLRFENDYGVDVGLLIDAARERARILEVDVGRIAHDSKPLDALADMAGQVARTILERAGEWGRLRISFLREARERDRVRKVDFTNSLHMMRNAERLALIDMDGTLLGGRFVMELAERVGRTDDLSGLLDNPTMNATTRTRNIARVFKGVSRATFEQVARAVPLNPGAVELVVGLRKLGFLVGIVTDSYRLAAETVRRRVFADFTLSHVMKFKGDKATGIVTLCPLMRHPKGCKEHRLCKVNVLRHLLDDLGFDATKVLAVGDSDNDRCLLAAAGVSVAYNPKSDAVREAAQHTLNGNLKELLKWVGGRVPTLPEMRTNFTFEETPN